MALSDVPQPLASGKRLDDVATLANNPLIGHLSMRKLGTLLDLLDQVAVVEGAFVTQQGHDSEYVYFVLEGRARLTRNRVAVRDVGPGDHFGELALIGV